MKEVVQCWSDWSAEGVADKMHFNLGYVIFPRESIFFNYRL
jgi:hypothetical protein